jgi:hypothetical protein
MLRSRYCVDKWLIDDIEVVSVTHHPRSALQKHRYCLWYSFLLKNKYTLRPSAGGRIKQIDNIQMTSSDLKPATFRLVAWYLNRYDIACPNNAM